MGCGLNKCSPVDNKHTNKLLKNNGKTLLDCSDTILEHIISYIPAGNTLLYSCMIVPNIIWKWGSIYYLQFLSLDDALWNIGATCRHLMHVTLKRLKEIRLDWRPKTRLDEYNHDPTVAIRQEAAKLYWISGRSELIESIKVFSKLLQMKSSQRKHFFANHDRRYNLIDFL